MDWFFVCLFFVHLICFMSKMNFIALFSSSRSSIFALSTLFWTAILFMCLYITQFQVNHTSVVRVLQVGVLKLIKSLCKYIVHLNWVRFDHKSPLALMQWYMWGFRSMKVRV